MNDEHAAACVPFIVQSTSCGDAAVMIGGQAFGAGEAPPRAAALHLMARAALRPRSRRCSMRSVRVVLLLGCFLIPLAAQAQFQEQISVEVVDVPVYVFVPQGPITNLTRD